MYGGSGTALLYTIFTFLVEFKLRNCWIKCIFINVQFLLKCPYWMKRSRPNIVKFFSVLLVFCWCHSQPKYSWSMNITEYVHYRTHDLNCTLNTLTNRFTLLLSSMSKRDETIIRLKCAVRGWPNMRWALLYLSADRLIDWLIDFHRWLQSSVAWRYSIGVWTCANLSTASTVGLPSTQTEQSVLHLRGTTFIYRKGSLELINVSQLSSTSWMNEWILLRSASLVRDCGQPCWAYSCYKQNLIKRSRPRLVAHLLKYVTPWNRVLLDKLIVARQSQEILRLSWNPGVQCGVHRARHWHLLWGTRIQFTPAWPVHTLTTCSHLHHQFFTINFYYPSFYV
jgi:hypothetical protein